MFRLGGKRAYSFSDKTHSKNGILSTVIAVVAAALLVYSIVNSVMAKGAAVMTMGFLGMVSFFLCIIGLVFGISGYFEEETHLLFKNTGTIGNGVLLLFCIGFIVLGIL